MNTMNASLELRAADELARLLPSPTPLAPNPERPERPAPGSSAVVATFVGGRSAELVVIPHEDVAAALAQAGNLSLAEALRPALEAASTTLGAGVLGPAELRSADDVLGGSGMVVVPLEGDGGVQAWFGMAVRGDDDGAGSTAAPSAQPAQSGQPGAAGVPAVQPAQFPPVPTRSVGSGEAGMRVLYDVEMTLTVEIGRTRLPVRDVLDLTPGTVLELDRSAGAPADVMVNGRLVARGEIVVVDDEYAVRISEIVSGADGVL